MTDQKAKPNPGELSELAALYAIDVLDLVEHDRAEGYLADVPEFTSEVADFQAAVAAIAYDVPLVPMATDLKDRLLGRISSDIEQSSKLFQLLTTPIETLIQQAETLEWEPLPAMAGASMATLAVDQAQRKVAFFVRATMEGQFPRHHHATGEEILVVSGDLVVDDKTYHQGDRIYSAADTAHQPETPTGCLLFCVSSLDDQLMT